LENYMATRRTVRAKFRVHAVRPTGGNDSPVEVHLAPVTVEPGDNAEWSGRTPDGQLSLLITNPRAYRHFEVGQDWYLSFERVDEPAELVA
jgi:hypothetical protein